MDSQLTLFERAFDAYAECSRSRYTSKREVQAAVIKPGTPAEDNLSVRAARHDPDRSVVERCSEQHVRKRIQSRFLIPRCDDAEDHPVPRDVGEGLQGTIRQKQPDVPLATNLP